MVAAQCRVELVAFRLSLPDGDPPGPPLRCRFGSVITHAEAAKSSSQHMAFDAHSSWPLL